MSTFFPEWRELRTNAIYIRQVPALAAQGYSTKPKNEEWRRPGRTGGKWQAADGAAFETGGGAGGVGFCGIGWLCLPW